MKPSLLAMICLVLLCGPANSQIGISLSGNAPDPSSMMDVVSDSKGVLIPRLTAEQRDAISNPAVGLEIFNLDTKCFNMWNGTEWRQSCYDCDFDLPALSSNSPVCEGATLTLNAATVPGASYSWIGPNGFSSSLQNPSISNATALASGVYFLAIEVGGCTSHLIPLYTSVYATPSAPVVSSNSPVCVGQNLQLTASSIPGASYSWTGPGGFSANTQNPIVSSVQAGDAGSYSVSVTVNGCVSSSASTSVAVNALPDAGVSYAPNNPNAAPGQNVTFTPTVLTGTHSWTFQSGTPSVSSAASPVVTWANTGTYAVGHTVTDTNGCSASGNSTVTIDPPQDKIVFITSTNYSAIVGGLSGADAICQGRAAAGGLSGTYKAWLSDATQNPANRFTHSNGPYKMLNGVVIANNWADLVDGTIGNNGIDRTEFNTLSPNTGAITNTKPDGTTQSTNSSQTCNFFSSDTGSLANQGSPGGSASYGSCCGGACWTEGCSSAGCNNSSFWKIYCFEQ